MHHGLPEGVSPKGLPAGVSPQASPRRRLPEGRLPAGVSPQGSPRRRLSEGRLSEGRLPEGVYPKAFPPKGTGAWTQAARGFGDSNGTMRSPGTSGVTSATSWGPFAIR